jgi:hypothetical protein
MERVTQEVPNVLVFTFSAAHVVYGNTILFERHVGVAMLIIFFTSGALVSQKVFYELKVDFILRQMMRVQ